MNAKDELGQRGEQLAADFLEQSDLRILDRNWRCRDGELDLVCRLGGTVVFCEVKARRTAAYGTPADAVTAAKRRRLRRLAAQWLADRHVRCAVVRFDVAAITGDEIEVVADAF